MNIEPPKPYKEERPWGWFLRFTANQISTVKIISVKPNESLSLQTHKERAEFWKIIDGSGKILINENKFEAKTDDEFFIPIGAKHRAEAGQNGLKFLEIALGEYDENDIERFEDKYNRAK